MHPGPFDLALIGGGLQNAVILLAALHHRPESRILMVEREERLGGNHTWSFHTAAIKAEDSPFIEPLVAARWPRHRVLFPEHERGLEQPYASILSDRLDEVVRRLIDGRHINLQETLVEEALTGKLNLRLKRRTML